MTEQTDPTLVDNVSITSTTEDTYSALNTGDNVSVTAFFSESVIVDNASGNPTLTIVVGTDNLSSDNRTATYWRQATNNGDLGNDMMYFRYTIQSGDNDTDGISIDNNSLALNGSTIRDSSGNYANITHGPDTYHGNIMVDTTAPTLVDNVSVTSSTSSSVSGSWNSDISLYKIPANGSLCDGSVVGSECYIFMTATFSESVIVDNASGNPTLTIVVGDSPGTVTNRTAAYTSGNE
ncbi:uncharacterized protein METZ01_LOCUS353869, partial [marine metagenome]